MFVVLERKESRVSNPVNLQVSQAQDPESATLPSAFATKGPRDLDILETSDISFFLVHSAMLIVSARARILWGHAPRVRSAAAFSRGLATVADHTDSR